MPTIYASNDPATLHAEVDWKGLRYGWKPSDFHNQMMVGMRWELQAVVDLTSSGTRQALGVRERELTACDWVAEQMAGVEPVTQAIARAAFERMAEGLVVPSARRKGGMNVVFFPSHRRDGTLIEALDETSIPFSHGL